jgi:hypothetical protein
MILVSQKSNIFLLLQKIAIIMTKTIANKVAERIQSHVKSFLPPNAFQKSAKATAKKESSDYRNFQMYLDSTNDKSGKSILQSVPIFEDGDPETWCDWRRHIDDLFTFTKIKDEETDKKIQIITSVLRGKALESFRTYQAEQEAANDKRKKPWYDEDVLEHILLNDMALEIFPTKHSYRRQVFYRKYHIFMGDGTTVKLFEKRVNWLNQCLKYFPMIDHVTDGQLKTCESLGEDDLRDIYTLAIKQEWTSKIMESNADPYYDLSLTELIDYLVKLEQVDKMKTLDDSDKSFQPNEEGKHQRTNMIQGDNNDEQHGTDNMDNNEDIDDPKEVRACPTCGKHHRGHCWHKNKNDKQGKKFRPGSAGKPAQEKTYTMEEIKEVTQ